MFTGIFLTLAVGILWSFTGVFYKIIAKWKLSVFNIVIVSNTFSFIVFSILIISKNTFSVFTFSGQDIQYSLFTFAGGFINMVGSLFLQRSMLYGKSGVTWALGQSALIIPFVSISLIFHEPLSVLNIQGTILTVFGMFILSLKTDGKDETAPNPRYGIFLAIAAFWILGIAQSMVSSCSYLPNDKADLLRPIWMIAGSLLATWIGKFLMRDFGFRLNKPVILVILLLVMQGIASMSLQFLAMDELRKWQINGIFFPLALGTCILAYSLYSVLFFKEKGSIWFVLGLMLILCGISFFCMASFQ